MSERIPTDAEAKVLNDPKLLDRAAYMSSLLHTGAMCVEAGWLSLKRKRWAVNKAGRAALARWQEHTNAAQAAGEQR